MSIQNICNHSCRVALYEGVMVSRHAVHDHLPKTDLPQAIVRAQAVRLASSLGRLEKLHLGTLQLGRRQVLVRHLQLEPERLDGGVQVLVVLEVASGHQLLHRPLDAGVVVRKSVALFAQLKID